MTPTSIGGEKQACISGGVNPPADIASGRIAEVRSRSMSCNCMTRTSQQECRGILELISEYPVLSMTMHDGLVLQDDRFKKAIASKDKSDYKVPSSA